MEERGVNVDHATLNRWVIRYAPTIAAKAHSQKRNTNRSWRMDETYIKVNRRAILPHETLGTPVAKYSFTYGANWISPSTPCVRFNYAQKPLR